MSKQVTVVPAKIDIVSKKPVDSLIKRKVAGYARVSTDHDEQFTSYEAQIDYYTKYIMARNDWEFVKVYSDEGISGTSMNKRDGLNEMIKDALDGKIDLIITKSVSRFARNTVDSLQTVRKLKEKGVEIYFEKENIWTMDSKGEMLITIMSSLAQEESRSISENVLWGQRKKFADGRYSLCYSRFLGYDKGENGELVVNEEQAKIVKRIFALYIKGLPASAIARKLTDEGVPTAAGGKRWHSGVVLSMLSNEKYKGDALLQKNYQIDYLSKKRIKNKGEVQQYYVKDDHEAIIDPELFDYVQNELKNRRTMKGEIEGTFSYKVKCGDCGGNCGRKLWHSNDKYAHYVYRCNDKYTKGCSTKAVYPEDLKQAFVDKTNELVRKKKKLLESFDFLQIYETGQLKEEMDSINEELDTLNTKIDKLVRSNSLKAMDQEEYNNKYRKYCEDYNELANKLTTLKNTIDDKECRKIKATKFLETIKKQKLIKEFDQDLFDSIVDHMTIYQEKEIKVTFRNGLEL